jgi:hypothetical protein
MAALTAAQLTDLSRSTGGAYPDARTAINDASNRGTGESYLWSRLLHGLVDAEYFVTGLDINQPIKFKDSGTATSYGIGADRTWRNIQTLENMKFYRRKVDTHFSFLDEELVDNQITSMTDFAAQQFVDLKHSKEQDAITSGWNLLENQLAAVPDPALMEGATTATLIEPYSIFAAINERTDGLFLDAPGGDFTVKAGLDPTDVDITPNYTPIQETYTQETIATFDNPLEAIDRARRSASFGAPETFQQYYETPSLYRQVLLASNTGVAAWNFLQRSGQQNWEKFGEGGVFMPAHHGVPIMYWDPLDTVAIYTDGSNGLVTETSTDASNQGPRFYGINGSFMHPVINPERFWYVDEVFRHPNNPETWVVRYVIWWTLRWSSLRRHFIVSPSGTGLFS